MPTTHFVRVGRPRCCDFLRKSCWRGWRGAEAPCYGVLVQRHPLGGVSFLWRFCDRLRTYGLKIMDISYKNVRCFAITKKSFILAEGHIKISQSVFLAILSNLLSVQGKSRHLISRSYITRLFARNCKMILNYPTLFQQYGIFATSFIVLANPISLSNKAFVWIILIFNLFAKFVRLPSLLWQGRTFWQKGVIEIIIAVR